MSSRLTKEQIDDLLIYCGSSPRMWKSTESLVCCPVHGEHNPSMGVSEDKQVCHCFSCGFVGDFAKLLSYSRPDDFGLDTSTPEQERRTSFLAYRRAQEFLESRYELEVRTVGKRLKSVKRYEQQRFLEDDASGILPMFKIAPFMSGKETYSYFFQRGFTKEDLKKFKIGRDLDNKTITIPVFDREGNLVGVIGRYIAKNRKKNQRYKIYWDFNRGNYLYPLDKVEVKNDTVIIVEGQFDAIRMHSIGFTNTLAMMTGSLSRPQAKWLLENCATVIWLGDNDARGIEGREKSKELLKGKIDFKVVDYPNDGKDVCDWSKEEISLMIQDAHSEGLATRGSIKRMS